MCVRSGAGCEALLLGNGLLVILRTWMDRVMSARLYKGGDVCLRKLSVHFLGWASQSDFNAYSIIKLLSFSSAFMERFSEL